MAVPVVLLRLKDGREFEISPRSHNTQLDSWSDPAPYQLADLISQYFPAEVLAEAPRVLQRR